MLDADVEVDQLDFQPFNLTQSLSLSSLEVSDGPSSALLQVSSLTVAVDLPSLLQADLVFDEVSLKDAQVSAAVGEDGQSNWQYLCGDERLLPDQLVAARALADLFNGAMSYHAEAVSSTVWPADLIDVRVDIDRQGLLLRVNSFGLAGGTIEGTIAADTSKPVTESELELDIKRVDLNQVLSAFDLGTESAGLIAGRVNYCLTGDTIADMAASADGGAFLLMTGGQLDAVQAELIGIDISEVLIILLNQGEGITTPIE